MRLTIFSFLPLLCYLPTVFSSGLFESALYGGNHLTARLVQATLCAQVTINVPLTVAGVSTNVVLANDICLCVDGGVLTPNSAAQLSALVNGNSGAVNTLLAVTGGLAQYTRSSLLTTVNNIATSLLNNESTACQYPTGAIPRDCGTCNYDCPANQYTCGDACIDSTKQCISGRPVGRRGYLGDISDSNCPTGKTACAIPASRFARHGFECLDVQSDIESCGHCANPLPGRPKGVDCTAIEGVLDIQCLAGACVVQKCQAGWELNKTTATCEPIAEGSAQSKYVIQKAAQAAAKRDTKAILASRQVNSKKLKMTRSWEV